MEFTSVWDEFIKWYYKKYNVIIYLCNMINSSLVAEQLLKVGAVKLSPKKPFTWASGWHSPIYCDNRKLLSFVEERTIVKNELLHLISEEYSDVEMLAGVATAGISWGAILADELDLPFIYVRPKPKEHGMGNQIEGVLSKDAKVLVIEDLISTGNSSLQVCKVLQKAKAKVVGLVSIFNYGFPEAIQAFTKAKIPFYSVTNYKALIDIALEKNIVSPKQIKTLLKWQESPSEWKK